MWFIKSFADDMVIMEIWCIPCINGMFIWICLEYYHLSVVKKEGNLFTLPQTPINHFYYKPTPRKLKFTFL